MYDCSEMSFIERRKKDRIKGPSYIVKREDAGLAARFHLYSLIASRAKGAEGWESARIHARPRIVYDLSGLPLFYDFMTYRGRASLGNIRMAANKSLGSPIVSAQTNPEGWSIDNAVNELNKLVTRKYRGYSIRSRRLVCYSYPKLALMANLVSRDRKTKRILMDVGDYTEIPLEPGLAKEMLGQVPYSLLSLVPEQKERENIEVYDKVDKNIKEVLTRERKLEPRTFYALRPAERVREVERSIAFIKPVTERTLDYCCHAGSCHDHECFCMHAQENSVHCARAAAQSMMCYWKYCYSQHEIAQAYGVSDTAYTPVSAVVPGLESLTNNCFDATLSWTVNWADCESEIQARRPFMSCVPGHARACAGTKKWNIWIVNTQRPRYLYIHDPWPPNTGAIYWENFNTTNYLCNFTLARRTTNHT